MTDKPVDALGQMCAPGYELSACRLADGSSVRVPALGVGWAHCVNTRLILTRREVSCPILPAAQAQAGSPPDVYALVHALGVSAGSSVTEGPPIRAGGRLGHAEDFVRPMPTVTRREMQYHGMKSREMQCRET